jgi:hypothetical protein
VQLDGSVVPSSRARANSNRRGKQYPGNYTRRNLPGRGIVKRRINFLERSRRRCAAELAITSSMKNFRCAARFAQPAL